MSTIKGVSSDLSSSNVNPTQPNQSTLSAQQALETAELMYSDALAQAANAMAGTTTAGSSSSSSGSSSSASASDPLSVMMNQNQNTQQVSPIQLASNPNVAPTSNVMKNANQSGKV